MSLAFAILLGIHGLLHLLGAAKGFGVAELPQLTRPIGLAFGMLWLGAAILFPLSAALLFMWPRGWWATATFAIMVSTVAIIPSWADARCGMLVFI